MNGRRRLVVALTAVALAPARTAFAQQAKTYRIGFLSSEAATDERDASRLATFVSAMRERGYVEGRNIVIEARYAEGRYERLPQLAAELVKLKVDVLVAAGSKPLTAAKNATTSIPIVMGSSGDAVGLGVTTNLARPTGNVTGWTFFGGEVSSKLVELLKECAPRSARIAYLLNPAETPYALAAIERAAASLNVALVPVEVTIASALEAAFEKVKAAQCDAALVQAGSMFAVNAKKIADLALKHRLASGSPLYEYADVGGLIAYGPDRLEGYRRAAYFTDKLLKGARVADLPIEQADKFEFIINMRTAKSLGLTIPQTLQSRARLI
jgi:putative ABC transport system substrate-binding protein